ncbi:ribonucleoside-triphosphate reductase [Arcanobacterium wilhelmae]|uniref:Ribonucleoside-triphosphate reductase n=2 Tax=Arcanobacterium wilhelmae TaxID=1803177 RepID=A0ABT9NBF1_9ACTO|nr:ribonucleoside-triphosphate reductase [Arcanobacterium wilhelmae]
MSVLDEIRKNLENAPKDGEIRGSDDGGARPDTTTSRVQAAQEIEGIEGTERHTITSVHKRDGRTLPFEPRKLVSSIERASFAAARVATHAAALTPAALNTLAAAVIAELEAHGNTEPPASAIGETVARVLSASGQSAVARAFRAERARVEADRARSTDIKTQVGKLLSRAPEVVNENANKDSLVFNTQRDLTAGSVAKAYALADLLPAHVANAHMRGDIHFHDLDYSPFQPMTNCCIIDIPGMLAQGFQIGNARVESPRSINTAAAQITQIIANVASSQYGGCSVDRADEVLAPYAQMNYAKHLADAEEWVAPDKREAYAWAKTRKDIYDAMQSLEYEINTLYSSNGQTPFVTVGFGLGTGRFEREIQRAILQVRITGIGAQHHTAIFPKLIFGIRRGVNLEPADPNYDIKKLALECSAKRMYPDILNYDAIVDIEGDYKAPMGCRSFLPRWVDPETGRAVNAGRMNLGVVTLNVPRIAIEAAGSKERFWALLDERMNIVHDALDFRARRCEDATPASAPILYQFGAFGKRAAKNEPVHKFFAHHRATVSIGYIGLYEAACAFYGPAWENDPEAKEFTLEIVRRLAAYAEEWKADSPYWYSVYSTPSESLTDRFAKLDRAKFGEIPNITDKGYYTNSFHYDVRKKVTPFEKIDFEAPYPHYAKGGFIHYCEYPKLDHNLSALEAVWDYSYDRVAYLGTNTPIDHCYECGFEGEFSTTAAGFACPDCGNTNPETCDVVRRTCGYLGNPMKRPMAAGRQEEIVSRVKHLEGETRVAKRGE